MNRIACSLLGLILIIVGINALGGGYYGAVAGAPDVPKEWLAGSPFDSYLIPSLILLFVVGGSTLSAAFFVFRKHPKAKLFSIAAGTILLTWIATQVSIIGYVSWLQPAMAIAGLLILGLSTFLAPATKIT